MVVQTSAPEHPAIRFGARGDYAAMARHLEDARRELGYPPFGRLCRVLFEDQDQARGLATAMRWAEELARRCADGGVSIQGPNPAPLALVRGKHRCHFLLKAELDDPRFAAALAWLVDEAQRESRTDVKLDVDPVAMM